MREIVHLQAGQCGNQIGAKVGFDNLHLPFMISIKNVIKNSVFHESVEKIITLEFSFVYGEVNSYKEQKICTL